MEWYNADCLDDHLCFLSDVQGWSAEFGSCWRRRWAPTTKQGREDEDVFEIMVRMIEFWTWSMRTIVTGFTDEFVQKLCIEKPLILSCLETEEALLQLFGGLKVRMTSDQCIAMRGRVSLNLLMSLNRSVALMSCVWNISVACNQEAFLQGWGYSKREWLLRTNDAGFNDEFVQKLIFLALAVHGSFQLLWTKGPRMRTIEGEIKSKSVDELVQKRCTLCRLCSLPYHTRYLSPEP